MSADPMVDGVYVVACYGDRYDPTSGELLIREAVSRHLEAVEEFGAGRFGSALFVVNTDSPAMVQRELDHLDQEEARAIPFEILIRPNRGYSYGAWADGLERLAPAEAAFAFLIEDDYAPALVDFSAPFVEKLSESAGFVCQLAGSVPGVYPRHAAVSNGAISMTSVREALNDFGQVFSIFPFELDRSDYTVGCENQVSFLALIESLGYEVADIAAEASVPFFEVRTGSLIERGTAGAPAPLRPLALSAPGVGGAASASGGVSQAEAVLAEEVRRLRVRSGELAIEVDSLAAELNRYRQLYEAGESRIAAYAEFVAENERSLSDLRAELVEVANDRVMYSQKLEKMENSLSWRLTKPLRRLRGG